MQVSEEPRFSAEYHDLDKRAIGNSVQVFFNDGTATEKVSIDYPLGHHRRRDEGIPLLEKKFADALAKHFPVEQSARIYDLCLDQSKLEATPVNEFMDMLVRKDG